VSTAVANVGQRVIFDKESDRWAAVAIACVECRRHIADAAADREIMGFKKSGEPARHLIFRKSRFRIGMNL